MPVSAPPADRAPGQRGWRAWPAVLALLGALSTLVMSQAVENGSWGGEPGVIDYRLDGPSWSGPVLIAAAVALVLAAVLLWAARGAALLAAGVGVGLLAVVAVVLTLEQREPDPLAASEVEAIELGTPEDEVSARLGWPAGHGTLRGEDGSLACLMYGDLSAADRTVAYALCFRDGRLAARVEL